MNHLNKDYDQQIPKPGMFSEPADGLKTLFFFIAVWTLAIGVYQLASWAGWELWSWLGL